MKFSSILIAAAFAAITIGVWAWLNRPTMEPRWPDRVQGMAFSPFNAGQDPLYRELPSLAQIDADLQLLAGKVNSIRTYSSLLSLGQVPALAARHQLKVTVGAWLDRQRVTNEEEVQAAIDLAQTHSNVIRVIIGNESILRGDLRVAQLARQLDRARAAVTQPVSTAEPWHVWIRHPELVDHVDFITVHLLPYWEGVPVEQGLEYVRSRVQLLQRTFPGKEIVIGEVGWPSDGRTREAAVASTSNEALFLRRFVQLAENEGYIYYLMEAFDQPWKAQYEGAVGAYWGIYNVNREPKFAFVEPIVRIPQWHALAGTSVALAMMLIALFFTNSRTLGTRGRSLLAIVAYAAAATLVWIVYDYSQQYLTLLSAFLGCLLLIGMLGVIAVLLAEAHEWAEARFSKLRTRAVDLEVTCPTIHPKVSIHVPASNEPAQMLIDTLNALAQLDYDNFEVIVIDNNTPDESLWQPVEAHCRQLGTRFRFFHLAQLAGFKAGALNFALRQSASDAEIVAVIDSDYQVQPHWLHDLLPLFAKAEIAIVQAPQDYRDEAQSAFKAMCYAEYRGFFYIGMVTRNERNAIIQHGTMTLVRHSSLKEVGGWAEWCITEDAELGLRLFERGFEAQYVAQSYGRGLMPDRFRDFKKQRFRWAYGAVQILRKHRQAVFSRRDPHLTAGQRYHFIAGWLPWLADGVNLLFNIAAICWSIAMVIAPNRIDPPLIMFSVLPLSLFAFRLVKLAHLYTTRVGANFRQTAAAAIAGLALSHTIGVAVVKSLFTQQEPFRRTPKNLRTRSAIEGLLAAAPEIAFLLCMLTLTWILTHRLTIGAWTLGIPEELKGPDLSVWVAVMLIQSIPYAAALLMSVISVLPLPARLLGISITQREHEALASHRIARRQPPFI